AVLAELRHLGRPHVWRHHVAVLRDARQLAAEVVELFEVAALRALRRLHAERRVAAGAALAGDVVAVLDLLRPREEAPERLVGVVDQRLGDAVVADARETPLAVGGAQLGHEGVAVAVVAADVEGRDPGTHGGVLHLPARMPIGPRRRAGRREHVPAPASAAALTAAASWSRVDCISASSSASTVTRTTGSVPDGRRKARPCPSTAASARASASSTAADSAGRAPLA